VGACELLRGRVHLELNMPFRPAQKLSEPFKIIDESDPQIVMDIGFVAR
jgi:hypothetical protein